MFGRATITLGIGPHSSFRLEYVISKQNAQERVNRTQPNDVLHALILSDSDMHDRRLGGQHSVCACKYSTKCR